MTDDAAGGRPDDDLAATLAEALGRAWGRSVAVSDLHRLSGGASRETWSFTADDGGRTRALILQRVRLTPAIGDHALTTEDLLRVEDALLAAAAAHDVPVPTVVVASDAAGGLGAARITEALPGEALGPRLVRAERTPDGRRSLVAGMGRALAGIHRIPVEGALTRLERQDPLERARVGLDLVGEARPAFELALRWLADRRPPPSGDGVVHGDFRIGNLLVEGDDLRAVLDWELAHLGDPLEDLGWLCVRAWRFGATPEVGGIGHLDDLLDAYSGARGVPVDPDHVRWWIVAGTLRWGLICAVQARRHLDGHVSSVELATIGRRVCENEHDVLDLIGVGDAEPRPDDRDPDDDARSDVLAGLHGRPTSVELIDAVRDHLRDRISPLLDGADRFSLQVVDRALATVGREVAAASVMTDRHRRRLADLGVDDEAELAARIRAGEVDAAAVGPAVREAVVDRLLVADPRWLRSPGG